MTDDPSAAAGASTTSGATGTDAVAAQSAPQGEAPAVVPDPPALDLAHALPGAVLTVFVGATAFLGLKATEVDDVLRNQPVLPSIVAFILLMSVVTAVLSMTDRDGALSRSNTAGSVLAVLGIGSLVIFFTPIPLTTTGGQRTSALVIGVVLIVIGAFVAGLRLLDRVAKDSQAPAKLQRRNVLLVVAVLLVGVAIYGAMRLEAISQVNASYAQVGAKLQEAGTAGVLTVNVSGSKLRDGDRIGVTIYGLPWQGIPLTAMCATTQAEKVAKEQPTYPCLGDPCYNYFTCEQLDGLLVEPNADGVADETFSLPFSTADYQHLKISAQVCQRESSQTQCSFVTQTSNGPLEQVTRLDVDVPRPTASAPSQ